MQILQPRARPCGQLQGRPEGRPVRGRRRQSQRSCTAGAWTSPGVCQSVRSTERFQGRGKPSTGVKCQRQGVGRLATGTCIVSFQAAGTVAHMPPGPPRLPPRERLLPCFPAGGPGTPLGPQKPPWALSARVKARWQGQLRACLRRGLAQPLPGDERVAVPAAAWLAQGLGPQCTTSLRGTSPCSAHVAFSIPQGTHTMGTTY